jgi:hypothetical protein
MSLTLWPRIAEVGRQIEPASFVGDVLRGVEEELGRSVSWTWNVDGRLIDEITKDDCILIAKWLRKRAEALGGEAVGGEAGIDDPLSLNEFADFFERSGGVLITA